MTAIVLSVSGYYPFGSMTNQMVSRLLGVAQQMARLQEAIATASSGYGGTPGTEFEIPPPGNLPGNPQTLFGVTPSETPGEQGSAYSFALGSLNTEWEKFWTAAAPFIEALDNGSPA